MTATANVHHMLEHSAATHGGRPALTHKDSELTYEDLWHLTRAVGGGLRDLGIRRGERVAVFMDKRPETVISLFGASAAGAVFVPVNPALKPLQVSYILTDCDVRVLVTTAQRLAALTVELKACRGLTHVVLVDDARSAAGPAPLDDVTVVPWAHVTAPRVGSWLDSGVIDVDMAAILYTSGSTGRPKGVVLSHRNLIAGAQSVSQYLGNRPDDVILAALPLSFDAGLSQLTTAFAVGAHVILMNYLVPADVPRLCARHGVTGLTCVPPLWIQIAEQCWPADAVEGLRYFANTGGKMPRTTLDRLRTTFPSARPYLMYGLTEAFRSTYLDPDQVDARPGSIGKAIPNAEVLVVRPDGSRCAPGEEGELVHRGALVAMGYWNDPARTAERFRPAPGSNGPWSGVEIAVWSGDTVVADDDGFLYFVGRKDDMIKTSGYRVSPTEIEDVAYDSGLVRDAVALGLEDDVLGQRVVLVATATGHDAVDVELLLTAMRAGLPRYMVPSEVIVRPALPRSPNGKFDRALLRKELTA